MPKVKAKLTPVQKRARKKAKAVRQREYMWVFVNGKQVRVEKPSMIEEVDVDKYIEQNAEFPP